MDQAKTMAREDKRTLYVRMSHLEQIDPTTVSYAPADLRNVIETRFQLVRESLNAAVPLLLSRITEPDLQQRVQKARQTDELKYVAAIYDLPFHCGIRDLRTEQLGRLTTICGTVTRTTEVKPELLVGTFQCNECQREVTGISQQFKVCCVLKRRFAEWFLSERSWACLGSIRHVWMHFAFGHCLSPLDDHSGTSSRMVETEEEDN